MLLLFSLLLGVIWWQLPAVLNWGLTQVLQQQGLTNIAIKISDVGASQALVEQLDASYVESDTELRIQLGEVRLEYSLSELMKGRAEGLFIDSVALRLDHRPSPQVSTSPTLPNIEQLLAAFQAVDSSAFPVDTVKLPKIVVSHNLASESVDTFDTIGVRAEISKIENRLTAKLLFANQQALHWVIDAKSGWNVQLFDRPAQPQEPHETGLGQAVFSGTLNQVDQSLAFSANIESSLAKLFDNSIDAAQMSVVGNIKGGLAGPGLAIMSTIQISDLEYQSNKVQILNAQFDFQIAQASVKSEQSQVPWKFDIKFDNTVSLINASSVDWRVDKLALSANGDLSVSEGITKITSSDLLLTAGKLQRASELEVSDTSFAGAASIIVDAEKWQIDLTEPWQMTSQYGRLNDTEFPQGLSLRSSQPTRITGAFSSTSQSENDAKNEGAEFRLLEKTSLEITMPTVQDLSVPLAIRQADASLQINRASFHQGHLSASGFLSIPQLTIVDDTTDWPLANLKQSFEFKNEVLNSRGSVDSTERDLHIETISKHELKQQRGETEFRFKTIKFKGPKRLNQLTSPLVLPAKLVAGELKLSGRARWTFKRDEWQTSVDIDTQLIDLGGAYDETYFSGVNTKSSLQIYPDILSRKPLRLTIAHVDVGVANTDMVVEFTVRPSKLGDLPIVDLLNARTKLLRGSMSLKPGAYDLNRGKHSLQVVMENIDLSELVRVQQLEDIQATGLVTGELPIVLENGQVSIDNGQLKAIAPGGTLRYKADADALKTNKYAETVMLALSNFNYDALRADTHYAPDGTLLLKLQLQGNNPDFEQGRQVNLNINLEQNVLKLFESLRLVEGVSGTLDKRVQDFYQQTTSK